MNRGPVHLHIDELVLEGFEPTQGPQIADAVEKELVRLLETAELRGDPGTRMRIGGRDAGSVFVKDRSTAAIGRQLAQAVGTTLTNVLNAPTPTAGERSR